MESIYVHIPFCSSICSYCDFCKVLYNRKWTVKYLDMLKKEITDNYDGEDIKTLYIGGGTPSSLSTHELNHLFDALKIIKLQETYEFTFECNIMDIDETLLGVLKENRVNRLSIGIESFDKDKLHDMDRPYKSFKEVSIIMDLCHKYGFDNINLDLIYGFKDEKLTTLKDDLNMILDLHPTHISTYSLMVSENTFLGIDDYKRLDDEKDSKLYKHICKRLKSKGYVHYEVSNFALPGYESIHNLNYWDNNEYYGFGLGASGNVLGLRYDNTKSLTDYLNGITKVTSEITSKQENMENELILGLRKLKGVNLQTFYDKFGCNLQEVFPIQGLVNNKEIIYKNGYIYIPEENIYVMNEILVKLL